MSNTTRMALKRHLPFFISLAVLLILWFILQPIFHSLRNNDSWPGILLVPGLVLIGVCWILNAKYIPWFVPSSYLAGFLAGLIFQQNGVDPGGGDTNSFWAIWMIVYVAGMAVGIVLEVAIAIWRILRARKQAA